MIDSPEFSLSRRRRQAAWLAFLLAGLTLVLFGQARGFGYISLDDFVYVSENPMLSEGLTWEGVRQAFTTVHEQWWLPMLWISYMADIEVFGIGPQGHHLVNVLLHAANVGLLFWVLFRMTGSRWRSFFVAALFAWHPTRVEAVAWIAARKDVLSGLFFMLALLAYVRHVEKPSAERMAVVFLLLLAGLMSKAILIVLPPILLLLDGWPLKRAPWVQRAGAWKAWRPLLAEKVPLIILVAVFMGINLFTHTTGRGDGTPVSMVTRWGMIAPNIVDYLAKLVVPVRLSILYPESDHVLWPYSLAALMALVAATWVLWGNREKRPYGIVGWLWFLIAIFPVVRGVRLGLAHYANRWTYLPFIGLGIALAWTVAEWSERPQARRWIVASCSLVLALCLVWTHVQLPWWKNSLTIFGRAVDLDPRSHFAQNSFGLALVEAGRVQEGEVPIRQAVRLKPEKAGYVANLGSVILKLGRAEEALALQDKAIGMKGDMADYHSNRGQALVALRRTQEAQEAYENALRLEPRHCEAHYNLGVLLFGLSRAEEALPHFQAAVTGRSGTATIWFNLGMAYAQVGRYAEAESCVQKALTLEPTMPGALAVLARLRLMHF